MLRKTAIALLCLIALLAIGIGILASEPALRWAVQQAAQRTEGQLQVDGVAGSLLGAIRFAKLTFHHPGTDLVADDGRIEWSPLALLARRVSLQRLEAKSLTIVQHPDGATEKKPPQLPERLQLPMQLTLDELHVRQLILERASNKIDLGELKLSARTAVDLWSAKLISLQSRWGKASGNVALNTQRPFPLVGALQASNAADPSYSGKVQLGGNLAKIDVRADAQAQPPPLQGQKPADPATVTAAALLTVFAATPFEHLQLDAQNLDLRAWRRSLPTARLEIHLTADGSAETENLRGRLQVINHAPGTVDRRTIPLTELATSISGTLRDLDLTDVLVDLGRGGKIAGDGHFRGGTLTLDLGTRDLNLQGLHARLKPTTFAGNLRVTEAKGVQRARLLLAQDQYRIGFDATVGGGKVVIKPLRAAAGRSALTANATLGLGDTKALRANGTLTQFDPSQFGKYPKGSLNGRFKLNATLAPVLHLNADLNVYASELNGLAANGTIKWHSTGTKTPDIVVDLSAKVGGTRALAKGALIDPINLGLLDLQLELEGADLAELYPIIGVPLPNTPPYKLVGHLKERNGIWEFQRFSGMVGRSDLSGDLVVDRQKRQFMRGKLVSNNLALEDLAGFIGARKPAKTEAQSEKGRRTLPDDPFNPDKLRASDANIWFTGRRVLTEKLPLNEMTAHLKLINGLLMLEPLDFGAAGGHIVSQIKLDARQDLIAGNVDLQVKSLKIDQLVPGMKVNKASFGDIDGRARLTTRGNSVARMLGSADGKVVLLMDGGAVSDLVLRLMDLDIAHAGVALVRGDKNIPVRCMLAEFDARDGVLQSNVFVLDTEHTLVVGDGDIDLREEKLNLKLVANPKDNSIAALRGPILIGGTFDSPSVRPELGKAIVRGAAAIALGIVATPLAAILPLIQFGEGKDLACAPMVARARSFINDSPATVEVPAESASK